MAIPFPLAHTQICPCQCMLRPGVKTVGRSDEKIELSCLCNSRQLGSSQYSYLSIACPWAPSGRLPVWSLFPSCCQASVASPGQQSQMQRLWGGRRHKMIGGRSESTVKTFVWQKMSGLAFRLIHSENVNGSVKLWSYRRADSLFYSRVVGCAEVLSYVKAGGTEQG